MTPLATMDNVLGKRVRPAGSRTGLARALSKSGWGSRRQGREVILAGRVRLNGVICRDPERPVLLGRDVVQVDDRPIGQAERVYLMLNKPRGLVTTAADERGRATVFDCLRGHGLPWVAPVGRLDQASEGLLLLTNDSAWAHHVTDPASHLDKTYHVQVDCLADDELCQRLRRGAAEGGELLAAKEARVLRRGGRNSWLELELDEGRHRHLRRLLGALEVEVLRLVRVAIGPLELGPLRKGGFRLLAPAETRLLGPAQNRT